MHPETFAAAALLAGAWVGALLVRGGRPGPGVRARGALFACGLVAGLAALNGPLHDLAETSHFSAHMVQHLLLTLVVPPCLLAGTPAWMMDALLGRLLPGPRARALARAATRPVPALTLHAAALVAWHLPGPYDAALRSHGWHVVAHVTLAGSAFVAWWPVLGPSRLLPPLPYAAQLLYLFAFGVPMTVVAAMITAADEVLYPFYAAAASAAGLDALADQRLGGVVMWVPAGIVPLVAFTAVFFRWVASEPEEAEG